MKSMIRKTGGWIGLLAILAAAPAHAIPSLQLYIDPSQGASYNPLTESWVISTYSPFTLTAFALDSDLGSQEGNAFFGTSTDAILSIALGGTGLPAGTDGASSSALGASTVDGNTVPGASWRYGTPPISTIFANNGGGDLPPHGEFPTWFAEYAFDFGSISSVNNVFNTQPPILAASRRGWRKDFVVDLSGIVDNVTTAHFDLYTQGGKKNPANIWANAPFSHDAEANILQPPPPPQNNPVPEPATFMLLGTGLAGLALFGKKTLL